MTETQQLNQTDGIALFAEDDHDFQPLAGGLHGNAYAWARAVIVDPAYVIDSGDTINFTLYGAGSFFVSNQMKSISLAVMQLDSTDPYAWGVDNKALRFTSTLATQVTISASLSRSDGYHVSGDREFTFINLTSALHGLPVASRTQLGCIQVGDGLNIETGVLSASGSGYVLPAATASTLGGVKQGKNVTITPDGTLSVADPAAAYTLPPASAQTLGGVKQGDYVSIQPSGVLSVDPAALTPHLTHAGNGTYGTAQAGTGLTNNNGVFAVDTTAVANNLPHASANQYGVVKAGYGLLVNNGVLSNNPASIDSPGIVQLASLEDVVDADNHPGKALTASALRDSGQYLPSSNPNVSGTVRISKDQTQSLPLDDELVTFGFLKKYLATPLAIVSPPDGSTYYGPIINLHRPGATIYANGTASPGSSVALTLNGSLIGNVVADGNGHWDFGTLNTNYGSFVLTATSNGQSVSSHFDYLQQDD